jgi:hypothetical protein
LRTPHEPNVTELGAFVQRNYICKLTYRP